MRRIADCILYIDKVDKGWKNNKKNDKSTIETSIKLHTLFR